MDVFERFTLPATGLADLKRSIPYDAGNVETMREILA